MRRSTNDFSDVIEGVTIDARATNVGEPVTITVEPDREAIKTKLDEFVTAYNAIVDFIDTQNTFTPSTDPDDNSGTTGALFGDSLLSSVQRSLRALFNVDLDTITNDTEGYSTLSLVGIETDRDGRLSIDETTFDEKFTENLGPSSTSSSTTTASTTAGCGEHPEFNVDTARTAA